MDKNNCIKSEDINFEEDAPQYTLADRNEIDYILPLKRVLILPHMHSTLPELSNQKKREIKQRLAIKKPLNYEQPDENN